MNSQVLGFRFFERFVVEKQITINGQVYVLENVRKGNRHVVVVDRGWIFAGDLQETEGRIVLTNAIHVFKWESIGFDGMLHNPNDKKVTLRKLEVPVDIPKNSEIFRIPVADDWGL